MSNPRRTLDEWFSLVQEARKSGMTDSQWCLAQGISRYSFNSAIKRLKKRAYSVPSPKSHGIHDFTATKQDVVKVDIVPDIQPPMTEMSSVSLNLDNSHMIEIDFGDTHIAINNGADPVLVAKTISLLRSYS